MTTPLAFDHVSKSYGSTAVLHDVHFTTEPGEFVVLVGPSGCGKSTLLRMVAGLETITQGEIRAGDVALNNVQPQDRGVGMVFQSYALYPHMTVRQNLAFPLRVKRVSLDEQEKTVGDVARLLGLEPLLDRRPGQLSGGQRQRVAIGRCLVRGPEVYCFDEPLSNLDAALRTQIRVEIKNLQRKLGKTTLYVTHDQVEAMTLADRIVVLHQGHVQQVGSPEELYTRPANRFVARFIGTPSMNLVRGTVKGGTFQSGVLKTELPLPDGPAVLGARAEDVRIASTEPQAGETFPATIQAIEPVGESGYLHLAVEGVELEKDAGPTASGDPDQHEPTQTKQDADTPNEGDSEAADTANGDAPPEDEPKGYLLASVPGVDAFQYGIGQTVEVTLRAPRCHAFDPHTGRRIELKSMSSPTT